MKKRFIEIAVKVIVAAITAFATAITTTFFGGELEEGRHFTDVASLYTVYMFARGILW